METRIPVPGLHAAPAPAPSAAAARAADPSELGDDDLDAVAGGLARAWTGAPAASGPIPAGA